MLDFIMVVLVIIIIALLSGVKIMFSYKYFLAIIPAIAISGLNASLIEGYRMGYVEIDANSFLIRIVITLALCIFVYRSNQHSYTIHNVMQVDVIDIIKEFLNDKNIKYEMKKDDVIYLVDMNKSIITPYFISTDLDCREIKDTDFYKELVKHVRAEIKNVKGRYFWIEVAFYVVILIVCYLMKTGF